MTTVSTTRRRGVNSSAAIKVPCALATTANITLSGEQSIDGTTTASSRVLVKNQTTASENGIYDTDSSSWTRALDFDGAYDVVTGTLIPITGGTTNAGYYYEVTNTGTITIGTTSLTFQRSTLIPGMASAANATAITIDANEFVVIGTGATVAAGAKLQTPDGITFPATQVASSDANTLDDYEEGTWTPVLSDGTNTATASFANGFYTKIGRVVFISCRLITTSLGSVTGSLRITGLPFTSSATTASHGSVSVGFADTLAITAGQSVTGLVGPSTAYIALHLWDAAAGQTTLQATEWSADGEVVFSGHYIV